MKKKTKISDIVKKTVRRVFLGKDTEASGISGRRLVLAAFAGLVLTASFPKTGFDLLAWIALVPLLVSVSGLSPGKSFRIGLFAGLVHYLSLVYWLAYTLNTYGQMPLYLCVPLLFLLCFYLALYWAVFSAMIAKFSGRPANLIFTVPVFWVGLEYVRSFLFSGFPWELLGYSQYLRTNLIQIADITGVYGVSFLILLANSVCFVIYLHLKKEAGVSKSVAIASAGCFIAAVCGALIYGKFRVETVDSVISNAPMKKVTVVQGNIDQAIKWKKEFQVLTTDKYVRMSISAKPLKPDLVVWPESATPFYFGHDYRLSGRVKNGVRKTGAHFLVGSPSYFPHQNGVDYFNSAYLLKPSGAVAGKYDKVHLVPFGEYVPLKSILTFAGKVVEHVGDFKSGVKGKILAMGDTKIGTQICYEIIFPELSAAMAKNGAELLVNITNDAWYGITSAPYQHFSMTVFRAVENKRPLVRAANTGISGFVDPAGRVMETTPIFQDAVITRDVPVIRGNGTTVYTDCGDWFAMLCSAAAIFIILFETYRRKKSCRTN